MDNRLVAVELEALNKKLNIVTDILSKILEADNMRLMNVAEIAEMLGISPKTLYKKPWLLPNFGASDGKMLWTKKEVISWLDRGTDVLLQEYESMGKEKAQSVLVGSN